VQSNLGKISPYFPYPKIFKLNSKQGTDSTIFAPFNKKDESLVAFTPDLCRSIGTKFVKRSKYLGVPTSVLTMDFGDLKNDKNLNCFCRDENDLNTCPPKGN
jgi:hypothetical protein